MQSTLNSKSWYGIKIPCQPSVEDLVCNFLFENDANGLYIEQDKIIAYFSVSKNPHQLLNDLQKYLQAINIHNTINPEQISIFDVPQADWNVLWKKNLKPIIISEKIAIKPSWHKQSGFLAENVIEIDPQMAFGTGSHETTRLVLRLIEKYITPNMKVLDIGTGTGILTIAATKLGVAHVVAFDNDPIAVTTAHQNLINNDAHQNVYLFTGTIAALRCLEFDLILANLTSSQIIKILPHILTNSISSPLIILSGILRDEENWVNIELGRFGLPIIHVSYENEWLALVTKFSNEYKDSLDF